ncbi:MAG TPA: CmcJ/NvfI family oxidoreductase [Novosphingobium sp.]
MAAIDAQTGPEVTAEVNYIRNARTSATEPKLEFVTEEESLSTMQTLPGEAMTIRSARGLATSLDREGFVLVPHVSQVEDFRLIEEDAEVDKLYTDEMAMLLREVTGGVFAMMLGTGKKRFGESATDLLAPLINAKPARYAHADNTDESAQELFARITEAAGGRMPPNARWALYNMWRAVSPPPQDFPLAVCDASSVERGDEVTVTAVTSTRGVGDMRHDTTAYVHNPAHRWHYFPDMTRDEVIVFKAHDSQDGAVRRVPHTAFTDPTCPPGTPTRASVEARGLVIFL